MNRQDRQQDYLNLRHDYPAFEYQSYSWELNNDGLAMSFDFVMGEHGFSPAMKVESHPLLKWDNLSKEDISMLVFHIGMVELISYWKLTCAPTVHIRPHRLDENQTAFWRHLYFLGLGEFFYTNGIMAVEDDFMQIISHGEKTAPLTVETANDRVMVPVGGGKDSVVTLELLSRAGLTVVPMAMNPREAVVRTINTAGFDMQDALVVRRTLDKHMLELNKLGMLNGHTPFSALLAFTTVMLAAAGGVAYIALSNEGSANESTVPGTDINHQYSKTYAFERDVDAYIRHYISPGIHYYSFLRPLSELQIGSLFSRFPQHFNGFRSCNAGSKEDRWCGNCPKCLFTWIILSPWIDHNQLKEIFGGDLLENGALAESMTELRGYAVTKPFECVGTPDEVNLCLSRAYGSGESLPALLTGLKPLQLTDAMWKEALNAWSEEHNLPSLHEQILKKALYD